LLTAGLCCFLRFDGARTCPGRVPILPHVSLHGPAASTSERRAQSLVAEWAELHRDELLANWDRARRDELLEPIDPLS
jgi:hypothetical protein